MHMINIVLVALITLLSSGCGGLPFGDVASMSASQLKEYAKIKDAHITCIIANTPYGKATAVFVNIDKSVIVNGSVTIDDQCKAMFTNTNK